MTHYLILIFWVILNDDDNDDHDDDTYISMVSDKPEGAANVSGFSPTTMFLKIARTRSIVSPTICLICSSPSFLSLRITARANDSSTDDLPSNT